MSDQYRSDFDPMDQRHQLPVKAGAHCVLEAHKKLTHHSVQDPKATADIQNYEKH